MEVIKRIAKLVLGEAVFLSRLRLFEDGRSAGQLMNLFRHDRLPRLVILIKVLGVNVSDDFVELPLHPV